MLDFTTQKKILDPIMKRASNQHCADCNSVAPTWVSLDFGVFLCSNCSGAHRGLGPTITRVRSANLDKWQLEWVENMKIGNTSLNTYWEADPRCAERKPNNNSTLHDIGRFVFQKYIKRKWVANRDQSDPLTLYKNGQYDSSNQTINKPVQNKPAPTVLSPKRVESTVVAPVTVPPIKKAVSLLDFDFQPTQPNQPKAPVTVQPQQQPHVQEEDEFTDFTQAGSAPQAQKVGSSDLISFETLMSQQQQPQPPQQAQDYNSFGAIKHTNMQLHHPYNPHIGQSNMVYQSHYQQQPHMVHQRQLSSMPHGYPQGYGQPGGVGVMPQGQFW